MGKSEGKRPLGRPRHRWEDNIKMDLQELGCWGVDWIELDQVVGTCECGNENIIQNKILCKSKYRPIYDIK